MSSHNRVKRDCGLWLFKTAILVSSCKRALRRFIIQYAKPAICTRPENIKKLSFVFTDKYARDLIPIMSHMNDYLQSSQVYYDVYYKYYHNHSLNITWCKFSKQSSQTD